MAIPVTTRTGKGALLTQTEMDNNFTNLARSATTTVEGNTRLATSGETAAGTSQTVATTPKGVADLFGGSQQLLEAAGYQKLPGGLILQWGPQVTVGPQGLVTVSFPIPFPNEVFHISLTEIPNGDRELSLGVATSPAHSLTQFSVSNGGSGFNKYFWWFAIGY